MLDQESSDVDNAPDRDGVTEQTGGVSAAKSGDASESEDPPPTGPASIPKDDAFHLLQNSRRRAVLRYLLDRPDRDEFQMRDIAEAVAAWEHDTTLQQLTSDQRQRVYIALYQSHLPKLDEHGIIAYNQPRGLVEPSPLLSVCEPFLENGLDADSQALTVGDAAGKGVGSGDPTGDATGDADGPRESDSRSAITDTLTSFLSR